MFVVDLVFGYFWLLVFVDVGVGVVGDYWEVIVGYVVV